MGVVKQDSVFNEPSLISWDKSSGAGPDKMAASVPGSPGRRSPSSSSSSSSLAHLPITSVSSASHTRSAPTYALALICSMGAGGAQ